MQKMRLVYGGVAALSLGLASVLGVGGAMSVKDYLGNEAPNEPSAYSIERDNLRDAESLVYGAWALYGAGVFGAAGALSAREALRGRPISTRLSSV